MAKKKQDFVATLRPPTSASSPRQRSYLNEAPVSSMIRFMCLLTSSDYRTPRSGVTRAWLAAALSVPLLLLPGCKKRASDSGTGKAKAPSSRLAPAMDHGGMALQRPAGKAPITPPTAPADGKVACGLPFGLSLDATQKEVRQRLLGLGMHLKTQGQFNPKAVFGVSFDKGQYSFATSGKRKGKLTHFELASKELKKRGSAQWYYTRFRKKAQKAWREAAWKGIPPTNHGPGRSTAAVTQWRCGKDNAWKVQLERGYHGGTVSEWRHDTKVSWRHSPPATAPPAAWGTDAKRLCKPLQGATQKKRQTWLDDMENNAWTLGGSNLTMAVGAKGWFTISPLEGHRVWNGTWKLSGQTVVLRLKSNMWSDERIHRRVYTLQRCKAKAGLGGLCLVRHDKPGWGIFACRQ